MNRQRAVRAVHYNWISLVAPWLGAALIATLTAGLWFVFVKDNSLKTAFYASPVIIAVGIITLWQQSRTRAKNRAAVLNTYAENEIARASIVYRSQTYGDRHSASVNTIA